MIDPKSRSLEWILESCRTNKVSDPTLMEKTIRAFSLLKPWLVQDVLFSSKAAAH